MTEKLYYADSHLFRFQAKILSCEEKNGIWQVIADRTAFFPEGGGQPADVGTLGSVRVLDALTTVCSGPLALATTCPPGHMQNV